jgi:hypothetical protein
LIGTPTKSSTRCTYSFAAALLLLLLLLLPPLQLLLLPHDKQH